MRSQPNPEEYSEKIFRIVEQMGIEEKSSKGNVKA